MAHPEISDYLLSDPLDSTETGQQCKRSRLLQVVGVTRDLMYREPRKAFKQRPFLERYFLSEPISARRLGSSNKGFRSRLRTI